VGSAILYVKAIVSKQRNVASHYSATFQTLLDTLKRTITKVQLPKSQFGLQRSTRATFKKQSWAITFKLDSDS